MKVLIIGLTPPEEGGSQKHIYEIAERVKNTTVLTQKPSMCSNKIELPILKGSNFIRNISFLVACFFYTFRLILLKKHDIIHIHENLLYILIPILKLRYKIIVTVHGIDGFKFYDNKFLWLIFRTCLAFSDKLIAVSLEDKKNLERYFHNLNYIPNGVDLSVYNKINVKVEKNITFIGRMHEQKGLIYLLEAFNKIKDRIPEFKLKIIGKMNEYGEKLKLDNKADRIIWLGYISDKKKIARELKSAYCIVLPSLWEGLPLTLFESLASQRPVIFSDLPVIRSITEKGVVFIKPKNSKDIADKILKVIMNNKLAESIAKEGFRVVKNYDWNEISKKMDKIYQDE